MTKVHPRSDTSGSASPFVVGFFVVAGLVTLSAVALGACVASFDNGFSGLGSEPLDPIPIPAASCPYLRAVHTTAEQAGEGWGAMLFSSDRRTWRSFSAQLEPRLATFHLALSVAIPRVPRPVATRLRRTLDQVEIGQDKLDESRTGMDYWDDTNGAVYTGYNRLSEASDLVGRACGFTERDALAPGLAGAFDQVDTTTTTHGEAGTRRGS